ncbi:MAG: hypothetical protein ACUVWP_08455 [bacterium]
MIIVDDVDLALKLYSDILRVKIKHYVFDVPPYEWVSLFLGNVEIMM